MLKMKLSIVKMKKNMWTLNFLKGRVRYRNTKVKIEKKVWVVSKNHKYVSCRCSQCKLCDENNFGQQNNVDLLFPKYVFILKIGVKNTQYHDVARGLGFFLYLLVIRPPYYIQMKFKGSFQLPRNRFMSCWVFKFWA